MYTFKHGDWEVSVQRGVKKVYGRVKIGGVIIYECSTVEKDKPSFAISREMLYDLATYDIATAVGNFPYDIRSYAVVVLKLIIADNPTDKDCQAWQDFCSVEESNGINLAAF